MFHIFVCIANFVDCFSWIRAATNNLSLIVWQLLLSEPECIVVKVASHWAQIHCCDFAHCWGESSGISLTGFKKDKRRWFNFFSGKPISETQKRPPCPAFWRDCKNSPEHSKAINLLDNDDSFFWELNLNPKPPNSVLNRHSTLSYLPQNMLIGISMFWAMQYSKFPEPWQHFLAAVLIHSTDKTFPFVTFTM